MKDCSFGQRNKLMERNKIDNNKTSSISKSENQGWKLLGGTR